VFLAQRFDELLFDYTLDSYKPAALNAPSLCTEALTVISAIEKDQTEAANLIPVLEELEWSIHGDIVAKSLMDVELDQYILPNPDTPLLEKKLRLEVLNRTLRSNRYIDRCKDKLANAVLQKHKRDIDFLARSLVTTLVNHGVSKAFLYQRTQDFFFKGSAPVIASTDALKPFLDGISPVIHDFNVFFIVSNDIKLIKKSLDAFGLKVHESFPADLVASAMKLDCVPESGEVIVEVENVRSFDCYSARKQAERRIDMLRDVFTLFSHRNQLSWREGTLINQCCIEVPVVVGSTKNAMQKRIDPSYILASAKLNSMISNLGLRHGSTFEKFNRIVDIHGICVTNDVPENQLLNLWISLETLAPAKGAKIGRVVRALEPFVKRHYVRRLVTAALRDLMIWNPRITRRVLRNIPLAKGLRMVPRLLRLLSLDTNSESRQSLYDECGDYHLLRYRIYCLHKLLESPKSVQAAIDSHWKKVDWQVRRIYRTRNSLVHTGDAPSYLGALIENGHDYLDMVLDAVIDLSCGERKIETLDQAFELEHLLAIGFRRRLDSLESFTDDNVGFLCEFQ